MYILQKGKEMKKFYYVYNPSQSKPKHKYETYEEARQAAEEVAGLAPDQEVYVLETRCCFKSKNIVECDEVEEKNHAMEQELRIHNMNRENNIEKMKEYSKQGIFTTWKMLK